MDMQVNPARLESATLQASSHDVAATTAAPEPLALDDERLDQLMRWHGTDEARLPPANTLKNLSRDTVAALHELQTVRENLADLRAAMSRAFWATDFRDVHAILLTALGPPAEDAVG